MELRTILFGYKKEQFAYFIEETESQLVREIFTRYISGETLLQIANDFTVRQVTYYKGKNTWTKNAIRRIIENEHYCGDMDYPPIIKKEEFIEANSKRLLKGGTREKDSKEIAWLKEHSYCEQCGKRFSRRSHWSHSREKWGYGCGCSQDVYIDDAYFFNKINTVINKVINAPKMLSVDDATKRYEPTLDIIREGKEINRMLEQPNPQFAVIKAAIYQSVSNKYSVAEMDTSGEFTALLIDHFEQIEHVDNFNLELLIKTVERISVKKNGEIIVTFNNKATVESEENSNGTSTEPTVTENSYEN